MKAVHVGMKWVEHSVLNRDEKMAIKFTCWKIMASFSIAQMVRTVSGQVLQLFPAVTTLGVNAGGGGSSDEGKLCQITVLC